MFYDDSNNLIPELPSLREGIIDAYENNKLVVFIGAGISRLAGCKGWEDMANSLLEEICRPATVDQLLNRSIGNKEKITIAYRYAQRDEKKKEKFWQIFLDAIHVESEKSDIYDLISRLNTIYITTNCDGLLIKRFPKAYTTDCTIEEFQKHSGERYNRNYVFCIHGNFGSGTEDDKKTLVFTVDKYLEAYQPDKDLVRFLRGVMHDNHVLFLGYGLTEFEILNACFESVTEESQRKHYLLEGFFNYQRELCEALSEYYSSLGINLIPYCKDTNGYKQQLSIISNWVEELEAKTSYNSKGIQLINDSLRSFNDDNKEVLKHQLLRTDAIGSAFRKAAFDDLPKNPECFKWLKYLCSILPINPINIPPVEHTKKDIRYVSWDFLDCLVACLKNQTFTEEEKCYFSSFVVDAANSAADNKDVLRNDLVVSRLIESYFLLGRCPKSRKEWKVFRHWASQADYSYKLVEPYLKLIISWPISDSSKLLGYLFSPGDKRNQEHRSYWFDKLAVKISELSSDKLVLKVLNKCMKYFLKVEGRPSFFKSFADRFHFEQYGYSISLVKSIKIFIGSLSTENKEKYINQLLQKAQGSLQFQAAFYFGESFGIGNPSVVTKNPLIEPYVFVDFYLWLLKLVNNQAFASEKEQLRVIMIWIENASFGLDLSDIADAEELRYYEKLIYTMKYQLLDLLSRADDSYVEARDSIKPEDRLDRKTPAEDMEQYYTVREMSPVRYFEGIDVNESNGIELTKIVIDEFNKSDWPNDVYRWNDILRQLAQKISDLQLESLLVAAHESKKIPLRCMTSLLADSNILKRLDKESVKKWLSVLLLEIQAGTVSLDEKRFVVEHYIRILQNLEECGWTYHDILQKVEEIVPATFFAESTEYNDSTDVITNLINAPESELYVLAIDAAAQCKGKDEIIAPFKEWFMKGIVAHRTKWVEYACSYRLQNIYYIDKTWAETVYSSLFGGKPDYCGEISLCMCCGSGVVMPKIVEYISDEETIGKTCYLVGNKQSNERIADAYISYMVAAAFYGMLLEERYQTFLSLLSDNNAQHLVWACAFRIKSEDDQKKLSHLEHTYDLYCESHDRTLISVSIIDSFSRLEEIDSEHWRIIHKAVKFAKEKDNIWSRIERCLEKTKLANDEIEATLECLCEGPQLPYDFTLRNIMAQLARIGMLEEVRKMGRYAIKQAISPNEFYKYEEHPEQVLVDFAEE